MAEQQKDNQERQPKRPISRRQAIKAGGVAALGLVFSQPLIETIRPKPAFANYIPAGGTTPPTISPTSSSDFTVVFSINDPQGRIEPADTAFFTPAGASVVSAGVPAIGVVVSADGTMLSGQVSNLAPGDYDVSVRPNPLTASRFPDLTFNVPLPLPTIEPTSGPVGSGFTLQDAAGRVQQGDVAIFFIPGTDPTAIGNTAGIATDIVIGSDGTSLTAKVPNVPAGLDYEVTVRPGSNLSSPGRFADLDFTVTV